jgi:two-component system, chemotaxis family, CheB/CheR fusion protein
MVVLGLDHRIRRLTAAATKVLEILPSDVGRPIANLKLPIDADDLEQRITTVIEMVQTKECEVQHKTGRWYALRIHPYRTSDNAIDGAVMVLEDIHQARDYAEAIVETARYPLLVLDSQLRVRSANPAFYRIFHTTPRDTEGQLLYDLGHRQWDIPALRSLLERILPGNTSLEDFEVRHEFPSIGPRIMMLNARRIVREGEGAELILLAI